MKTSPIIIARETGLAVLAAGMLTACSYIPNKTDKYFENKPVIEYQEFINDCNNRNLNIVQAQAKLDSLAYRELFNTTEAINNSDIVNEFNNIANIGLSTKNINNVKDNLKNTGLTKKEYDKTIKDNKYRKFLGMYSTTEYNYDNIQHKVDSINYRNFFEKHNLLDANNLAKFEKITEIIRPQKQH